jgi:hypothetical protein
LSPPGLDNWVFSLGSIPMFDNDKNYDMDDEKPSGDV